MSKQTQFCTFFVDGLYMGIEVAKVQEIIRAQPITRVPRAANVIRGLMNLRGRIVTAIDLRRRLALRDHEGEGGNMNVVVKYDDDCVSLLVDQVGDVLTLNDDLFEAPPETMSVGSREMIRGVYKLEGTLMLVLAIDRVLNLQHRDTF